MRVPLILQTLLRLAQNLLCRLLVNRLLVRTQNAMKDVFQLPWFIKFCKVMSSVFIKLLLNEIFCSNSQA
jgi:hypothetical protein